MIKTAYIGYNTPSSLDLEVIEFINSCLLEIIDDLINKIEDDRDFDFTDFFPSYYHCLHNNYSYLRQFIIALRDTIASDIIYNELLPVQSNVLYKILDVWTDNMIDTVGYTSFDLPENLRSKFVVAERCSELDEDSEEYDSELELIDLTGDFINFDELLFDNLDFLEDYARDNAELVMSFRAHMIGYTLDEMEEYIDVMPMDIAQRFVTFKKNPFSKKNKMKFIELSIILSLKEAIRMIEKRVADHKNKTEEVLTADIQELIYGVLLRDGIQVSREYTLGRADKRVGRTDLYFYMNDDMSTVDIALLESKDIRNFKEQYFQLMGYLNHNFRFGITLSINRNMRLRDAANKIETILNNIEGPFAITGFYRDSEDCSFLASEHIVPETGNRMFVYHLILNLNDEFREEAAKLARKKLPYNDIGHESSGQETSES